MIEPKSNCLTRTRENAETTNNRSATTVSSSEMTKPPARGTVTFARGSILGGVVAGNETMPIEHSVDNAEQVSTLGGR